MGNICSGGSEEKKASAFEPTKDASEGFISKDQPQQQLSPDMSTLSPAEQEQREKDIQKMREEQSRVDLIVQATGRSMVAVRSTRGSNYYDQGFGAALAQHLEQTTQFAERVPRDLPPSHPEPIYTRISQPQWEKIQFPTKQGEDPSAQMDHIADAYLDYIIPKKERVFAGAGPIVENLL